MAESTALINVGQRPDLFEPYQGLIEAEQALAPEVSVDDTIRIKVLDLCGMTCTFCHNEGTPVSSKLGFQALRVSIYTPNNGLNFVQSDITTADGDSFQQTLTDLHTAGLAREVHWTGGEPTLSKSLPELTSRATEAGYDSKMTSNGQSGERGLAELANAGMTGVNFSIFGTTPEELAATQAAAFKNNLRLATSRLSNMNEAMVAACGLGLSVKANIVISGEADIDRGLRLLDNAPEQAKVRFQADTSNRTASLAAIYKLMTELGARPASRSVVAGCSIDNYDYELAGGRRVTFKQTRFSRLSGVCDNCPIDKAGECHEGYYGLRLYKDIENTYYVSPCIQRMDTAETVEKFLSPDGTGKKVTAYRERDYRRLQARYKTA